MKINIFRSIIILLLIGITLLISTVVFDLASYDSSYINRNSITFSINNLNSKKSKKYVQYYINLHHKIALKIS